MSLLTKYGKDVTIYFEHCRIQEAVVGANHSGEGPVKVRVWELLFSSPCIQTGTLRVKMLFRIYGTRLTNP